MESSALAPARSEAVTASEVDFNAAAVPAPFSLRCGAILIDYILLAGILVVSTLVARIMGGGARLAGGPLNTVGVLVALGATLFNFLVLTWTRGYTVGKWATGLRIVSKDGSPMGWSGALLRHIVGYPLAALPLGLGFFLAVLNYRGRGLPDFIAGTMVIMDR